MAWSPLSALHVQPVLALWTVTTSRVSGSRPPLSQAEQRHRERCYGVPAGQRFLQQSVNICDLKFTVMDSTLITSVKCVTLMYSEIPPPPPKHEYWQGQGVCWQTYTLMPPLP